MRIRRTIATALLVLTVLAPGEALSTERGDDISTEDVQKAASVFLAESFPAHAPRLEVRVVRVRGSASGSQPIDIRMPRAESVPRGHTQVRLVEDGASIGWALLYVAHFDSVAVVKKDVRRDDVVDASDITFAWMDVTTFRGEPLRPPTFRRTVDGEKVFATKPLHAGDALRVDDLRAEWAADTGERVVMTYNRNLINLRLTCQAREPGAVGDIIRLYSSDTKTTYKARLTANGRAEWIATL